ncbi:unnamed protein product [Closterium sp. NIES-54]
MRHPPPIPTHLRHVQPPLPPNLRCAHPTPRPPVLIPPPLFTPPYLLYVLERVRDESVLLLERHLRPPPAAAPRCPAICPRLPIPPRRSAIARRRRRSWRVAALRVPRGWGVPGLAGRRRLRLLLLRLAFSE